MKTVAIIQARMGSSRLPGKIMKYLGKLPLYKIVYNRVRTANMIDDCVFATTSSELDDGFCDQLSADNIKFFRGSENDVLLRYLEAAKFFSAEIIVRITCDDPFKDPEIIDKCVKNVKGREVDFSSNIIYKSFAEGLDVECFSFRLLEILNNNSVKEYQREHVTPYFYENKEQFKWKNLRDEFSMSDYRLTLDDAIDLKLLTELYEYFDFDYSVSYEELKPVLRSNHFSRRLVGRVQPYLGFKVSEGTQDG